MDTDGAVAVIGMACRYPGAETLEDYWELLKNGENMVKEVPPDRWNINAYYDPTHKNPEKSFSKWAACIDNIFEWDNEVFGITESEASKMDPQQKLAIEVSYKALENAGITLEGIKQTNTAVYMSQMNLDYSLLSAMEIPKWEFQDFLGTANSMLANKISYQFDLRGPSVTMDTGCSGALVTTHMGIQSIISGESDMAICGGVNFMLGPGTFITLSKVNMISPTGQCKAFSEYADGYVKGEGCGVLLLKNLDKAIADKNPILGVIKTTLSSDGRAESPITKPSKDQQKILIETACTKSRVDPKDIQYVECHGTGTQSGDPVEAWCVGSTIGKAKKEAKLPEIPVGSVKTNIGHLESAAATAALIKTLLLLKHGKLVPSLFSEVLNSKINFNDLHVNVNRELCDVDYLEHRDGTRLMAVISNGYGGTAGCALIQQNDHFNTLEQPNEKSLDQLLPVVFSATNESGLRDSMLDTLKGIEKGNVRSLEQLSYTSALHRSNYSLRHVAWGRNLTEINEWLGGSLSTLEGKAMGKRSNTKLNTVFVFCGMGSHWRNMGKELYETESIFRDIFDRLHILMSVQAVEIDLHGCLMGKHDLSEPLYGQPMIFAMQIALAEMLKYRGIVPDTVIGHSVGDIAAACVSGYLSLQEAVLIICQRAIVLQKTKGGSMLAIGNIPPDEVLEILNNQGIDIEISAYNSSTSCTLSGEEETIDRVLNLIREKRGEDVFLRKINVKVAYHSKYMDPVLDEFETALSPLIGKTSPGNGNKCRFISTVTGLPMTSETCLSPGYWRKNLRQCVKFDTAFHTTLSQSSHNTVVEIGPKPVLRSYIRKIASEYNYSLHASMTSDSNQQHFYKLLSNCFQDGIQVKWDTFFSNYYQPGDYPRYIYQRKYLHSVPQGAVAWQNGTGSMTEGFLGSKIHSYKYIKKSMHGRTTDSDLTEFEVCLSVHTAPFVFEHKYADTVLAPGGTYPELALEALSLYKENKSTVQNMELSFQFHAPLIPKETDGTSHKLTLFSGTTDSGSGMYEFDVTSEGILHATGQAYIHSSIDEKEPDININLVKARCSENVSITQLHDKLQGLGFTHGESLNWCSKRYRRKQKECFMELAVPSDIDLKDTYLHPVLVDTFFQACSLLDARKDLLARIFPQSIDSIRIYRGQEYAKWAYVKEMERLDDRQVFNGYLLSAEGQIVVKCTGLRWKPVDASATFKPSDNICHVSWKSFGMPQLKTKASLGKNIILFCDAGGSVEVAMSKSLGSKLHVVNQPLSTMNGSFDVDSLFPSDISNYDSIFFTSCVTSTLSDLNTENVSNKVADVCFALLQVVRFLQSRSLNIPLHILVKDTYRVMNLENISEARYMNACLGFAVAGMMRSVRWEFPQQCYRVIDIQDLSSDTMSLLEILTEIEMPELSTEIAIIDGEVRSLHMEHLMQRTDQKPRFLHREERSKTDVKLVRNSADSVTWTLDACSNTRNINEIGDTVKDAEFQLIRLDQVLIRPAPKSTGFQNRQVLCYDAIGRNQHEEQIMVCAGIPVSTAEIKVSTEKCFGVSVSPGTLPCISFLWSAWNIASFIQSKSWYIMQTAYSNPNYIALARVLELLHGPMVKNSSMAEIVFAYAEDIEDLEYLYENMECSKKVVICVPTESNYDKLVEGISDNVESNRTPSIAVKTFERTISKTFSETYDNFRTWIDSLEEKMFQSLCDQIKLEMLNKNMLSTVSNSTHDMNEKYRSSEYTSIGISKDHSMKFSLNENSLFRKDAAYIVIGGSKGLGWETVLHIAKNGAGKIGTISRSGVSIPKQRLLQNLERETGCVIIDLKADVTDPVSLQNAFQLFDTKVPEFPIKGIFFGTVHLEDCTISNMTHSKFTKALLPKISGVCNIYNICKNMKLDYLVLHSSIVSLIGNAGQTNYTAANAFLNGFAYLCRKFLGVGQSICWGSLNFGILEENIAAKSNLADKGLQNLSSTETLQCLNHSLLYNHIVASYSKQDFAVTLKHMGNFSDAARAMYRWFFVNKGHYLKKTGKDTNTGRKDIKSNIINVLQSTVGGLVNEKVSTGEKLKNLGVDSFEITAVYSGLVNLYGVSTNVQLGNLGDMTVDDIVSVYKQ